MRKLLVACITCVICMFIAFVPAAIELSTTIDDRGEAYQRFLLEDVPLVSLEELKTEWKRVVALVQSEPGDSPEYYFQTVDEVYSLLNLRSVYSLQHKEDYDPEFGHMHVRVQQTRDNLGTLQTQYLELFGNSAMTDAARSFEYANRSVLRHSDIPAGLLPSFSRSWSLLQSGFLLSLIPAFLLNVMRIQWQQKLLWPEFATMRIVLATIAWPAMLWFYPTCIVRKEQVVLALRYATYALSAMFSFGAVSPAAAQTKKKDEKQQDALEQTIERDLNFKIEVYPVSPGSTSEYVGPMYSWRVGKVSGLGFAEIGRIPFLTNHIVMVDTPSAVDARFELGYGPPGVFTTVGPQVDLNNTIARVVTQKVFKFLTYAHLFMTNKGMAQQDSFFWKTKELLVGRGFSFYSEGFYRARYDNPDIAQPIIWLKNGRWELGMELGIVGGDVQSRLGVKYAF